MIPTPETKKIRAKARRVDAKTRTSLARTRLQGRKSLPHSRDMTFTCVQIATHLCGEMFCTRANVLLQFRRHDFASMQTHSRARRLGACTGANRVLRSPGARLQRCKCAAHRVHARFASMQMCPCMGHTCRRVDELSECGLLLGHCDEARADAHASRTR